MVWSFVYLALHRLLELLVLCRSTDAKEVEILVLRHQLAPTPQGPGPIPASCGHRPKRGVSGPDCPICVPPGQREVTNWYSGTTR